jgi:hypothetical protein
MACCGNKANTTPIGNINQPQQRVQTANVTVASNGLTLDETLVKYGLAPPIDNNNNPSNSQQSYVRVGR